MHFAYELRARRARPLYGTSIELQSKPPRALRRMITFPAPAFQRHSNLLLWSGAIVIGA
jgi:hypothetical protein